MSLFEQFILNLVPAILSSILAALKVNPANLNPTLRTVLEAIDAGLDAILGDPLIVPPTPTPSAKVHN